MIEDYFSKVEQILQDFPIISSYILKKKVYSSTQGYIQGTIELESGHRVDFTEVKDVETVNKVKYRYHCMDKNQVMVFRYDNAGHHKNVPTFPHHKHTPNDIQKSTEPTLYDVLLEIAQLIRENKTR